MLQAVFIVSSSQRAFEETAWFSASNEWGSQETRAAEARRQQAQRLVSSMGTIDRAAAAKTQAAILLDNLLPRLALYELI